MEYNMEQMAQNGLKNLFQNRMARVQDPFKLISQKNKETVTPKNQDKIHKAEERIKSTAS